MLCCNACKVNYKIQCSRFFLQFTDASSVALKLSKLGFILRKRNRNLNSVFGLHKEYCAEKKKKEADVLTTKYCVFLSVMCNRCLCI